MTLQNRPPAPSDARPWDGRTAARIAPALAGIAATVLWAAGTHAAPGDAPPSGGSSEVQDVRSRSDYSGEVSNPMHDVPDAVTIAGRVIDTAGKPVAGVVVKLFVDGVTAKAVQVDTDGTFSIAANPMQRRTGSAVLWFQSPDPEKLVDAEVVLWQSDAAREQHLFSRCAQSIEGKVPGTLEVTLRSADELKAAVAAAKCLGAS